MIVTVLISGDAHPAWAVRQGLLHDLARIAVQIQVLTHPLGVVGHRLHRDDLCPALGRVDGINADVRADIEEEIPGTQVALPYQHLRPVRWVVHHRVRRICFTLVGDDPRPLPDRNATGTAQQIRPQLVTESVAYRRGTPATMTWVDRR